MLKGTLANLVRLHMRGMTFGARHIRSPSNAARSFPVTATCAPRGGMLILVGIA
jgi:hypothetical protein